MNRASIGFRTIVALALLLLLAAIPLAQKIAVQRAERSVETCISYQETLDLFRGDPAAVPNFLERCRLMGVRSVALREETLRDWAEQGRASFLTRAEREKFRALGISSGDLPKPASLWLSDGASAETVREALLARYPAYVGEVKIRKVGGYVFVDRPEGLWEKDLDLRLGLNTEAAKRLAEVGLTPVLALEEQGKSGFPDSTRAGAQISSAAAGAWLITGTPEASAKKSAIPPAFRNSLATSSSAIVLLETINAPLVRRLAAELGLSGRVIKGHTVPIEEMKSLPPPVVVQRYVRAVTERSVRFIYFHWNPDGSVDDNLKTLRGILQGVKSRGYAFENVPKNPIVISRPAVSARILIAFMLAVAGPWMGMKILMEYLKQPESQGRWRPGAWIIASAAPLLFGISINLLLPDTNFLSGLAAFKGVKASMVLPLVLMGGLLFTSGDAAQFVRRKAAVLDILIFAACAGALLLMLERSGNFSGRVHPLELAFRDRIETLLGVRPRFKEFAIGHPLLLLGLYLWSGHRTLSKLCLWAGAVGWISIVNTFCHLHTPVAASLLRTFHGLWLGGIIGLILVGLFRLIERRPFFQRAQRRDNPGHSS